MTSQSLPPLPLLLVLHNIRSLHNIGAIFRSADGAGVSQILLSGLTATPPRHEIEKTALGATKTIPWERVDDLAIRLQELKQEGYNIYALEQTTTSTPLYEHNFMFPAVLIVGHERVGIEDKILAMADAHVELPMRGLSAHSLNVSNATAIALYEIMRQVCYHRVNKG